MDPTTRLDLNLLRLLVTLLDTGSVSQTAVKLHVSQPTVSSALAKLRAYFGDPLFVRATGGMAPTPRGAEVGNAARDILAQIDDKLRPESVFEPGRRHRPFTLALSDVGEMVFLPRLIKVLSAASPDTLIRSVSLRPNELAQGMDSGEIDLAIGHFPDLKASHYFQQRLFTHHFVCLVRAGHAVQGHRLTIGEFLALQHVVVHSEGRSQEILEAHLEAHGLTRRIAVVTPHFLSLPRLIAKSDLIVTVPHAVGIAYGRPEFGLKAMQLPFSSPRIELRQHWHRKVHKDSRNMWLRKLVHGQFNAATDEW